MQLILLYGPPAVGKLTIAKELSEILHIPLADNHMLVNPIAHLFGWDHPERRRLSEEFRLSLFEAAAKEGISFITTLGGGGAAYDAFVQKTRAVVERHGGEVRFVRLMAPTDVLFDRVAHQSRVDKRTITGKERLAEHLAQTPDVLESVFAQNVIELDTSRYSPQESAVLIAQALRAQVA